MISDVVTVEFRARGLNSLPRVGQLKTVLVNGHKQQMRVHEVNVDRDLVFVGDGTETREHFKGSIVYKNPDQFA